ncbi:MAG: SdiA-regulated domain-containing protein [Myxococcota bacterium]
MRFSLNEIRKHKIRNKKKGLREPSGLTLDYDRAALWTVCDDDRIKRLFKLSLSGELDDSESFSVDEGNLEGIAHGENADVLYAVQESREDDSGRTRKNALLKYSIANRQRLSRARLMDMRGFEEQLQQYFFPEEISDKERDEQLRKGLEGLCLNTKTNTLFALKEGVPGILIEISLDLGEVLRHWVLDGRDFSTDKVAAEKVDYSGICFYPRRNGFFIVSDKAAHIYFYDAANHTVDGAAQLTFEGKPVRKAEGVAVDDRTDEVYVVSDDDGELLVYQLSWDDPPEP